MPSTITAALRPPASASSSATRRGATARTPGTTRSSEPTGNLDTATGEEIAALLDELHARGRTVVIVTHNEALARRAERVVRLRDGRVLSEERP